MELRHEKKSRFQIVPLEERIAPTGCGCGCGGPLISVDVSNNDVLSHNQVNVLSFGNKYSDNSH